MQNEEIGLIVRLQGPQAPHVRVELALYDELDTWGIVQSL